MNNILMFSVIVTDFLPPYKTNKCSAAVRQQSVTENKNIIILSNILIFNSNNVILKIAQKIFKSLCNFYLYKEN